MKEDLMENFKKRLCILYAASTSRREKHNAQKMG